MKYKNIIIKDIRLENWYKLLGFFEEKKIFFIIKENKVWIRVSYGINDLVILVFLVWRNFILMIWLCILI